MAPLMPRRIRIVGILMAGLFSLVSTAQDPGPPVDTPLSLQHNDPKRNLFAHAPRGRYYSWWRPLKVVYDQEAANRILFQIDSITDAQAEQINLNDVFRDNLPSAFLPPLLAGAGRKGAAILGRLISKYQSQVPLDDAWLLMISCLGYNGTEKAIQTLCGELERTTRSYNFSGNEKIDGIEIPVPKLDPRIAIADAILNGESKRLALDSKHIETLVNKLPKYEWTIWLSGLEWAQLRLREEQLLRILRNGLTGCLESDFRRGTNLEEVSPRLRAIDRSFLQSRRETWEYAKKLILQEPPIDDVVRRYVMISYMVILNHQAMIGKKVYQIDTEIAKRIVTASLPPSRQLSLNAKVLLACRPANAPPDWLAFLKRNAETLSPQDAPVAEFLIRRFHKPLDEPAAPTFEAVPDPAETIHDVGVHMEGFKGITKERMIDGMR